MPCPRVTDRVGMPRPLGPAACALTTLRVGLPCGPLPHALPSLCADTVVLDSGMRLAIGCPFYCGSPSGGSGIGARAPAIHSRNVHAPHEDPKARPNAPDAWDGRGAGSIGAQRADVLMPSPARTRATRGATCVLAMCPVPRWRYTGLRGLDVSGRHALAGAWRCAAHPNSANQSRADKFVLQGFGG